MKLMTTGRAETRAVAVTAWPAKHGPTVDRFSRTEKAGRLSSLATLKTRKAGFHLEMAETVTLRRVQEEKKLLRVKGRA